jgi:hypothetical protein
MVVILIAIVAAVSKIRYRISFGIVSRSEIAREDIAIDKGLAPIEGYQVMLPDGKIVNPKGSRAVVHAVKSTIHF